MITEEGAIKVGTEVNLRMQKELNSKNYIAGIIFAVLGGAGVLVCLILDIIAAVKDKPDTQIFIALICFAVVLGLGVGLILIVKKTNKTVTAGVKLNTYEFFTDYFTITEVFNGETVATAKVYNNQIIKSKETKNYMFFYINAVSAYPVCKEGLSQKELEELRRIFKLRAKKAKVGE